MSDNPVQLQGLAELEAKFNQMLQVIDPAGEAELGDVARDLRDKAKALAPIGPPVIGKRGAPLKHGAKGDDGLTHPGALRASLKAQQVAPGQWEVGSDLDYAAVQHERTDFNHPQGGQSKFLEQPFQENLERYIQDIGAALAKAMGL